jgi:anion-transporting  ArsA/GET3 family ATPase
MALDDLLARPLLFVTGKGGVGKTTVAGAIAVAAAGSGRRVLVCELAGRRQLAASLPPAVSRTTIEPQAALREWLRRQPGAAAAAALLAGSAAFQQLVAAAPGAAELITIGKVGDLVSDGRYDTVVVDAPATGHMLALVTSPRTYAGIAHGGRITRDAEALRRLLADRTRTAYVGVTLPEDLAVRELIELDAALRAEIGRSLDAAVVNQVWPQRLSPAEARRVRALAAKASDERSLAFLDAALRQHRRALAHTRRVDEVSASIRAPLTVLPQLAGDPLGADDLRLLGDVLLAGDPARRAA